MIRRFSILCFLFAASLCSAQTDRHASAPTRETYAKLAKQVDDALQSDVLSVWFPRAVDKEHGGFHSHFGRDWQPLPSDGKFSVFQGRMTWVASQVVSRDPGRREEFLPYVRQGLSYLQNTMWDKQYGGFYWGLDDDGKITPQFSDHKDLYGISFCIYGAAAAYAATKDPAALELARKGFEWADEHAHDAKNGGYFEVLTREGKPEMAKPDSGRAEMNEIGPVGYKSMNTHIHLLESLTELYRVWPNAGLRARVEEMLAIVRDKISMEPGVMNLYFTPDWRPIPDHDSYGHDVETAYLMLETDEVLHGKGSASTERMAKMLVDHALAYGWDSKNGGFFREGTTFGKPEDTMKEWWIQVEGLNALLLMHERYGRGNPVYFERFLEQWHFIQKHTIDAEHRGLWNLTSAEGQPVTLDKGSIWKAAYHDGRAFMNVSARLHKLADEK